MSASDDTQKKLIDSIRKTKQTAASKPGAAGTTTRPAESKSASTARRRTRKAPARKTSAEAAPAHRGYQAGRRVWPD